MIFQIYQQIRCLLQATTKIFFFFFFSRNNGYARFQSRFFPPENTILFIYRKRKKERKKTKKEEKKEKKNRIRYQKSFTTDRAKILKSIKIIECKTTISFFFFFLRRFNSSTVFLSAICLKKGEKDKRCFEKYAWKRV